MTGIDHGLLFVLATTLLPSLKDTAYDDWWDHQNRGANAVKTSMLVFRVGSPCGLACNYHCFGQT